MRNILRIRHRLVVIIRFQGDGLHVIDQFCFSEGWKKRFGNSEKRPITMEGACSQ